MIAPCKDNKSWIEFRLIDLENKPIPGEHYVVRLPDQSIVKGSMDSEGKVRFDSIIAGLAKISFPGIEAKEWFPL